MENKDVVFGEIIKKDGELTVGATRGISQFKVLLTATFKEGDQVVIVPKDIYERRVKCG